MSLCRKPVKVSIIPRRHYYDSPKIGVEFDPRFYCCYDEAATHAVLFGDKVYYSKNDEIWTFTPTESRMVFSRRILKMTSHITALFIDEVGNSLCLQLQEGGKIYRCDTNPKDKSKQPGMVLRDMRFGSDTTIMSAIFPVSSSGKHFAYVSQEALYFYSLNDQEQINEKVIPIPELRQSSYTMITLSDEQNKFLLIGNHFQNTKLQAYIFQFSPEKLELIDQFQLENYPNQRVDDITGIALVGGEYVLLENPNCSALDYYRVLDVKAKAIRTDFPAGDRNKHYGQVIFSSPYLIFYSSYKITVFDSKEIASEDFLSIATAEAVIDMSSRLVNLVAWPYDQERGQLLALAYQAETSKIHIALARFKKNCDLEKICDIDSEGIIFPDSMRIFRNVLYYRSDIKGGYYSKAFNPETGLVNFVNYDPSSHVWPSPMGILSGWDVLDLQPYPNVVTCSDEIQVVDKTCRMFSRDIVNLIGEYLVSHQLNSWSVPPAEIKRSPGDTNLLKELDGLLERTQNDGLVHTALKDLKRRLLFRTDSYVYTAREIERGCEKIYAARTKYAGRFFGKTKHRYAACQLLDKVKACDKEYKGPR